jgi:serine phosphatase RsbU (regulator of sigma subunit)
MARPFALLPAPAASPGAVALARRFLLEAWSGRVLLVAIAVALLDLAGLPLPRFAAVLDRLLLVVFGVWGFFRLLGFASRRLLWRIRSKLIVSYLFIGLVPVVLLSLFFFIAAVIFVSLVASHLVTSEVERLAASLRAVAQTALIRLPADDRAAATAVAERLEPARAIHSGIAFAFVRAGKVVAQAGEAPRALPSWWKGPGFAGLVDGDRPVLRAVWASSPDTFLAVDAPVDRRLFEDLEKRTGIDVLSDGELRRRSPRDAAEASASVAVESGSGAKTKIRSRSFLGMAMPERTDWATGKKAELEPLAFQFAPFELAKHLSPGFTAGEMGSVANVLVVALGAVGAVFLVFYGGALGLGLLLARSITRNVHALSRGTERLRQGDFGQEIHVGARDQLGELAESFNLMSRGIQDLLREQGEKERLEEELRIARQIQMSLLPPQGTAPLAGVRIAALCLPAAEVGGDYYDLLPLSDTRMGVLVADVSGKGTSAALYMAELKGLVLSLSRIYDSPAKLLSEANRILSANMDARSFITMTYAMVDTAAGTMRYARAGHNPLIHLSAASGRTRVLTPSGLGLGIDRGDRFDKILEEAEVPLVSGDIFLFFTDGLSEAMNPEAELFGENRLRSILEAGEGLTSDELKERILAEIRGFVAGAAQHDDMTLVILKVV